MIKTINPALLSTVFLSSIILFSSQSLLADWTRERSIDQISPSIYRWGSHGHNAAYILTDKGIILVDGQPCDLNNGPWIKAELKKRHDVPVKYIVLSHDHQGHICGTELFPGAVAISHRNLRPHLIREHRVSAIPGITFDESMQIHLGGLMVELLFFGPTHSDNLIQIHIPQEKVLLATDISRHGKELVFPDYRDMEVHNTIKVLALLSRIEDVDVVLPGHGPVTTQESFLLYRKYLSTLHDRVLGHIVDKKSLQEILQLVTMADFRDYRNIDRWLASNIITMYDYLHRYREPNDPGEVPLRASGD